MVDSDSIDRHPSIVEGEKNDRVRFWIRLLRASRQIEAELRERLKANFDTTLPRFDVMAVLYRSPNGMLMGDLSRVLLISGGGLTVIIDRLVQEGIVTRSQREGDRRTSIVRLTDEGRELFEQMSKAYKDWISTAMSSIDSEEARQLADCLRAFRSTWEADK
jgi:DNA-binding MarR family transcriptional regulator